MEPFYHLPPSATTRDTPSPYSSPRRSDLQSVTSEWLSLTLNPSTPNPAHSLTPTPVPPTPPPLPSGFAPLVKAPLPSSPKGDFSLEPRPVSRRPLFQQGRRLDHFSPISAPLPYLLRSSPSPDSSLRHRSKPLAQTCHISKPKPMFCTELELKSPPALRPQHSLGLRAENQNPEVSDPRGELLTTILKGCTGNGGTVVDETRRGVSDPNTEPAPQPAADPSGTSPARAPAGGVRSHQPARAEPLSRFAATQNERVVEFQRAPAVERSSRGELFIEEEEESAREEEEDVLGCRQRAPPQVEHGVSCICRVHGGKS